MAFQHGSLRGGIPAITARLLHWLALVSLVVSSTASPALAAAPSPESGGIPAVLQDAGPTPTPPASDPVVTPTLPITPTLAVAETPAAIESAAPTAAAPTFPPLEAETPTPELPAETPPAAPITASLQTTPTVLTGTLVVTATQIPTTTLPVVPTAVYTTTLGVEGSTAEVITPTLPSRIPVTGGVAEGLGGRVKARFPEWAAAGALSVYIRKPVAPPPGSPSGDPFEIVAFDASDSLDEEPAKPVTHFVHPYTLETAYNPEQFTGDAELLRLVYFDETSQEWIPLPTAVDTENHLLRAELDHLTVFDLTYANWEASRLPSLQPFQVAPFTGAGSYAMELWTPPGPGGLQPALSLSYNSQAIDNAVTKQTQAGWAGMGWSLEVGGIERNQNGTPDRLEDDTFSISAGGVDSPLLKGTDGYWHTTDESFWRIQRDTANDRWYAWSKDGTKYTFGSATDSRAQYPYQYGCNRNGQPFADPATWRWGLKQVTNVHGQSLTYSYTRATQLHNLMDCENTSPYIDPTYNTTIWLYPLQIDYPGGGYRVTFERAPRDDWRLGWQNPDQYNFYMRERLNAVRMQRKVSGVYQNIKSYRFNFYPVNTPALLPGAQWQTGGGVYTYTLTLQSVEELGTNGVALPATTFTYDAQHLTGVSNGSGGSAEFDYEIIPWYETAATLHYDIRKQEADKTHEKSGCSQPQPGVYVPDMSGTNVACDASGRLTVTGDGSLAWPEGFHTPGGMYRLTARVRRYNTGSTTASLSLAGVPIQTATIDNTTFTTLSGYQMLPAVWGYGSLAVNCANKCEVKDLKVELLTTRYRVTAKRLEDGLASTPISEFIYSYDEPATNDTVHSAFAGTSKPYVLPRSEYRGGSMSRDLGPDGQVTLSFYHQDDARKGRSPVVLKGSESSYADFEDGSLAGWSGSNLSVTGSGGPLDRLSWQRGDKALKLTTASAWSSAVRSSLSIPNGNSAVMQFMVVGGGAQALLVLDDGGSGRWGVKLNAAGNLVVYQGSVEGPVLITAGAFKRDAWYVLLLTHDSGESMIRVWERDNPSTYGWYQASYAAGTSWRVRMEAYNGTLYLDTLLEGRIAGLEATNHQALPSYDVADTPYSLEYVYTGLGIQWVRTEWSEALSFEPGGEAWNGRRTSYLYGDLAAFGNLKRTLEAYWDTAQNQWKDYRLMVQDFYPNTTGVYVVGLPGYNNTYACLASHYNGACLSMTLGNASLTSSTWYLYDGSAAFNTVPITGTLTGMREMTRWASGTSDARYRDWVYVYDGWGNRTIEWVYNQEGDFDSYKVGTPLDTTTAYDTVTHALVTEVKNALQQPTTYTYHAILPLPVTMTGPNGSATTIKVEYDVFGRHTKVTRPGDDETSAPTLKVTYHDGSFPNQIDLEQRITGSTYARFSKFYDGLGNLIQSQTLGAQVMVSGSYVLRDLISNVEYNAYGQTLKTYVPYAVTTGSGYRIPDTTKEFTLMTYDLLGRSATVTGTDSVVNATYTYQDLKTLVKNARNFTTTTTYDAWGRTMQVSPPSGTGPAVSYTYDTEDQLTQVVQAGLTTTLTYDIGGRKTQMADPDMGTWNYTYDARDNLASQTDARDCITTLTYDELSRLKTKTYSTANCNGSASVTYYYDEADYGYGKGHRTHMVDNTNGVTKWWYDTRGRVYREERHIPGSSDWFTTAWGYNSADQVDWMEYPGNNQGVLGEVVNYEYNNQLELYSAIGSATYVQNAGYDAANRLVRLVRGAGSGQLITNYEFYGWADKDPATNTVGQGARLKKMATGSLQNLSYVYDPVGNITTITDTVAISSPGQVQAFSYDGLDRLTSAQATGGTVGLDGVYGLETYAYDSNGRLAGLPYVGTYGYSTAHPHAVEKLGGVVKYVYDSNGNMTQRIVGGNTYNLTYNGDNRLVSVSGAATNTYLYNGDGERIKSTTYENLAFGLPVTSSAATLYWSQAATDGDNWADSGSGGSSEFAYTGSGLQYAQVDLGAVYTVDKVKIWHYAGDGRTYHNTKTQVSADGSTWYTVFDSAVSGEYAETAAGKTHSFTARSVRYVRDWVNGSTSNASNHWVEIEAYGSRTVTTIGNYFEWRGSTSTMLKHYYAGSQRVAMRTGATDLKWLLGDHLGSTAITANGTSGARESELRYKPWGELRYAWNNTPTDFRFTGQKQSGIGLMDYVARQYDPALGRFTSPDSIIPDQYQSLDWDRYQFVRSNPLKFNDPTGHDVGCSAADPACKSSNAYTPSSELLSSTVTILVCNMDGSMCHGSTSLGTVTSKNTVITHNHFEVRHAPTLISADSILIESSTGAVVSSIGKYTIQTMKPPFDLTVLKTPKDLGLPAATIASQETIDRLQSGDDISIVYYDDQNDTLAVTKTDYIKTKGVDGIANNPGVINEGDSGGGVYFNGQLIGVTSRIDPLLQQVYFALFSLVFPPR